MSQCFYCGKTAKMTVEHIVPRTRGGSDDPSNIVQVCRQCNSSKHNMTLEEWRNAKRMKIARTENGVPYLSNAAIRWLVTVKGVDVLEGVRPVTFWFEDIGLPLPSDRREAA